MVTVAEINLRRSGEEENKHENPRFQEKKNTVQKHHMILEIFNFRVYKQFI